MVRISGPKGLIGRRWQRHTARVITPRGPDPGTDLAPIPAVICVDVEPDEIDVPLHERRPWTGFEMMQPLMADLRTSLAAATGRPVRFAWFLRMDPQIELAYGSPTWGVDRYRAPIDDLMAAGDAIGIHPHAWRWVPEAGTWRADHGDPEWVGHCVEMSLEAYRSTFGRPCRDSRHGDRWMDDATMASLAAAGVRRDLTQEPGMSPGTTLHRELGATGAIPDYRAVPPDAFQPSTHDFRRAARAGEEHIPGIWSLPLTSGAIDRTLPAWRRVARRIRHGHRLDRPLRLDGRWPPGGLADSVERVIAEGRGHLAFAVRSDLARASIRLAAFEQNLAGLAGHRIARRLEFTTPEGALDRLGVVQATQYQSANMAMNSPASGTAAST